jgi:hypothetical protein
LQFPKIFGIRDPIVLAGAAVAAYIGLNMLTHTTGVSKAKQDAAKNLADIKIKSKKEGIKNKIKEMGPDDTPVNLASRVVDMARYWAKDGAAVEGYRSDMEDHLLKNYQPDIDNLKLLWRRAQTSNIPADREQFIAATNHMSIMLLNQWQIPVRTADSSFDYGDGYVEGRSRPYIQENPALRDALTVAEAHAQDAALSYWSFAFPENKIPDLFASGFRLTVS